MKKRRELARITRQAVRQATKQYFALLLPASLLRKKQ